MTSSTLSCGIDLNGDGEKFSLGLLEALGMCGDKFNYTGNCAGWKPIRPSREDILTPGTKRQILAHNTFGVKIGCWPIPGRKESNLSEKPAVEPRQP